MAVAMLKSWARFSALFGEALSVGDVACIKDSDGKAYKADANDATLRSAAGIVSRAADINAVGQITISGIFNGYSALTEGGAVYLSETPGETTQSAPAWKQQIGRAISPTEILFGFGADGA